MPPKKKDISKRKQRQVLKNLQEKGYDQGLKDPPKKKKNGSNQPPAPIRRRYKPGSKSPQGRIEQRRAASEDNVNISSYERYQLNSPADATRFARRSSTNTLNSTTSSTSSSSSSSTVSSAPSSTSKILDNDLILGSSLDDKEGQQDPSLRLMNKKIDFMSTQLDFETLPENSNENDIDEVNADDQKTLLLKRDVISNDNEKTNEIILDDIHDDDIEGKHKQQGDIDKEEEEDIISNDQANNQNKNLSHSFRSATMNDVNQTSPNISQSSISSMVSNNKENTEQINNNEEEESKQTKHMNNDDAIQFSSNQNNNRKKAEFQLDVEVEGKVPLGESIRLVYEKTKDDRWLSALSGDLNHNNFKVRDFGYSQSKLKIPSDEPLYEAAGGDCTLSSGPVSNFAAKIKFPYNGEVSHPKGSVLPNYFIVNLQIPLTAKALFGNGKKKKNSETPTANAVYYFKISDKIAKLAKTLDMNQAKTAPPALRLFRQWCQHAPNDTNMSGRFKAIGFGFNFDEVKAPSFIKGYNGKPVLFASGGGKNRVGFVDIHRGQNYLEVDVDMAKHFSYLAQKGISWGMNQADKLDLALAFLIEGRTDDELPESVIGCAVNRFVPVLSALDHSRVFNPLVPSSIPSDVSSTLISVLETKFGNKFSPIVARLLLSVDIKSENELKVAITNNSSFISNIVATAKSNGELKAIQMKKLSEWLRSIE